jgi:hypothetical protein
MASPKIRTGIWFVIAVAAVIGLWYGGNELYTRLVILPRDYPRLQPGRVSLIGFSVPGYHIVVSNGIARLQVGSASTFVKPLRESAAGTSIPMRGLVGTLRFDPDSAVELVRALNDISYEIEPLPDRIWTKDRIHRAVAEVGEERKKLEYDLATRLDGRGVERVSWDRLTTGIWIEVPVPLRVPSAKGFEIVTAKVLIPFRTRLSMATENNLKRLLARGRLSEDLRPEPQTIAGVYNEALDATEKNGFEDVAASLLGQFSATATTRMAGPAQKVLGEVEVLVTEETIVGAEMEAVPREDGKGDFYSILLRVAQESRDRLWQYTYRHPASQLLLVSNGVAIAAPVVRHEIKYSTVEITGIAEQQLAEEALAFIEAAAK